MVRIKRIYSISATMTFVILDVANLTWQQLLDRYQTDILVWSEDSDTGDAGGFLVLANGTNIDVNSNVLDQIYGMLTPTEPTVTSRRVFMTYSGVTHNCKWATEPLTRSETLVDEGGGCIVPLRMTYKVGLETNDLILDCINNCECLKEIVVIDGLVIPYEDHPKGKMMRNIRQWVNSNVTDCIATLTLPSRFLDNPIEIESIELENRYELEITLTEAPPLGYTPLLFVGGSYIAPEYITILANQIRVKWAAIALDVHRDILGPMVFREYLPTWTTTQYRTKILELGFDQAFFMDVLAYESMTVTAGTQPYLKHKNLPMLDKYGLFNCYKRKAGCPERIVTNADKPTQWLVNSMLYPPLE